MSSISTEGSQGLAMQHLQLINAESADVVVPRLSLAATFWTRFRGLQFRRELPADEGLLIVPCGSVHTHWMRFAIDVVMIDADGRVQQVQRAVRPWKMCSGAKGTRAVLELPAESATLNVGDRIAVRVPAGVTVPRAIQGLTE